MIHNINMPPTRGRWRWEVTIGGTGGTCERPQSTRLVARVSSSLSLVRIGRGCGCGSKVLKRKYLINVSTQLFSSASTTTRSSTRVPRFVQFSSTSLFEVPMRDNIVGGYSTHYNYKYYFHFHSSIFKSTTAKATCGR